MIITVTMNPAIDKTVDILRLERGELNRIQHVELDAGGKGINVSKTIKELGGESIATGFLGGNGGRIIEDVMKQYGICTDFIQIQGETRTNLKVVEQTGEVTELNEPGPAVGTDDVNALIQKLEGYANPETLFVLAGSIPAGMDADIYKRITERVHEKGAKVLMDADGALFLNALEAGPDMLKPNRFELEEFYHVDYCASIQELVAMGRRLLKEDAHMMAISMGRQGAVFLNQDHAFRCPGLSVKTHSTVGAGDAMVAAMAYSWSQKLAWEECVKLCMAASAGAVTTIGTKPPTKKLVEQLASQVEIKKI